jgi:hypothetical protein
MITETVGLRVQPLQLQTVLANVHARAALQS